MTKSGAREEQQFCSRCHAWGPADTMQPLYRSKDAEAGPWLWMHHHCAEICSSMQFEAAMKRFEFQVHSLAELQGRGPHSRKSEHAKISRRLPTRPPTHCKCSSARRLLWR